MRKKLIMLFLLLFSGICAWKYYEHSRMPDYRTAIVLVPSGAVSRSQAVLGEVLSEVQTWDLPGDTILEGQLKAFVSLKRKIWLVDPQSGHTAALHKTAARDGFIQGVMWSPQHDKLLYSEFLSEEKTYIFDVRTRKRSILANKIVRGQWYDNDHIVWVDNPSYSSQFNARLLLSDMNGHTTGLVRQKGIVAVQCDPDSGVIIYGIQFDEKKRRKVKPYILNPRNHGMRTPRPLTISGSSDSLTMRLHDLIIQPGGARIAYAYYPKPQTYPSLTQTCIRKLEGVQLAKNPEFVFAPDEYPGAWHSTRNALLCCYIKEFKAASNRFYPFVVGNGVRKQLQPEERSDIFGINLEWSPDGESIAYGPIYHDAPFSIRILDNNGRILKRFNYPSSHDGCYLTW